MLLPNIPTIKPFHRRVLLYLIDAGIICASLCFGLLCYGFTVHPAMPLLQILTEVVLIAAVCLLIEILCRLNNIIWQYAGVHEYLYLILLSGSGGIFGCVLAHLVLRHGIPPIYYLFCVVLCTSLLALSRILYCEFRKSKKLASPSSDARRLLILGAGDAGSRLLDEIRTSPFCGLSPIGFLDDDLRKHGRSIGGVCVLGSIGEMDKVCREKAIDTICLAIPSLSSEQRAAVLKQCLNTDCTIQTLPVLTELNDKKTLIGNLRSITPEELLGREPVQVADAGIMEFVRGKTVVITGGGGSIGSELCRKIAANQPERLIIIDVYENNAYAIQQELIRQYGSALNLEVIIATVCDFRKINAVFAAEKPDIVIHAAAHKHVPLMETVPDEAVKNNVFGTFNTVMAARENKVGKMILISTDKAVNPTNIMGATKRMCEMIIQYADSISPDTTFAAVRFGNVLGSNGSVIPLFKKQIEEHRDLTVTHPEMIRYFMTISEASQLVLTASAMANGGEIFVLDMGEPVKIDDLARNMIRLSGLTLGKDINIQYIGLRPGEKLYEELLMSEEGLNRTPNKKIYIGKTIPMDYEHFLCQLDELRDMVEDPANSPAVIEEKMREIVPTFRRTPQVPVSSETSEEESQNSKMAMK